MPEDLPALDAPIDHVTVYCAGAVVRRRARLSGRPGHARITGLPLCLDDASVVARVQGEGAPVVTDVRVALEVTDRELPEPPVLQAVEAARLAEAQAADRVSALQEQAEDLTALQSPDQPRGKRGAAPPAVPLAARLALLDFQHARLAGVQDALLAAGRALQTAREHREKLEHDWRAASTARQPRARELRKAAHLTLVGGAGAGPWTVEVEYQVPGARWTPSYALRFDARLEGVQVVLRAAVAQCTGEDWRGVRLTVSTAWPLAWTELPALPALRIGSRQPPPRRTGWREAPEGADALYADYRAAVAEVPAVRAAPKPPSAPRVAVPPAETGAAPAAMAHGAVELEEAPAPPRPTKKSRGRGRRREAPAGAPPQGTPAPVAMARSRSVLMAKRAGGGPALGAGGLPGGSGGPQQAPAPATLVAPVDLLDYGRLRLSGPDAARPGHLRPVGQLELYQESVAVQGITLDRSALAGVQAAARSADLSQLELPPFHQRPAPLRGFDHAWSADHPLDLDSDGAWHTLRLQQAETSARRRYVAVPREASEVFRVAAFDNPLDAPLPPGPADVYVGGELLLTTPLRATDRGGAVRLGLGVEEGIKLARNTRFAERTTGLLGGTVALAHEVDVEVANNLPALAEVEVRERLPVRREDDDEVGIVDVVSLPPWQPWDQEDRPIRGAHRWVVQVPAHQTRLLELRYTVEISSKRELVGGNRREA